MGAPAFVNMPGAGVRSVRRAVGATAAPATPAAVMREAITDTLNADAVRAEMVRIIVRSNCNDEKHCCLVPLQSLDMPNAVAFSRHSADSAVTVPTTPGSDEPDRDDALAHIGCSSLARFQDVSVAKPIPLTLTVVFEALDRTLWQAQVVWRAVDHGNVLTSHVPLLTDAPGLTADVVGCVAVLFLFGLSLSWIFQLQYCFVITCAWECVHVACAQAVNGWCTAGSG